MKKKTLKFICIGITLCMVTGLTACNKKEEEVATNPEQGAVQQVIAPEVIMQGLTYNAGDVINAVDIITPDPNKIASSIVFVDANGLQADSLTCMAGEWSVNVLVQYEDMTTYQGIFSFYAEAVDNVVTLPQETIDKIQDPMVKKQVFKNPAGGSYTFMIERSKTLDTIVEPRWDGADILTYQDGGISYTLGYVTEEDANNYLKVNTLEEAIHMMKDKMLTFITSLDTMVLPEITAEDGTVTSGTLEVNGKVVTTPEELQAEVEALKTEMEQAMTIYDNILIDDTNCPVLPSTSAFDELKEVTVYRSLMDFSQIDSTLEVLEYPYAVGMAPVKGGYIYCLGYANDVTAQGDIGSQVNVLLTANKEIPEPAEGEEPLSISDYEVALKETKETIKEINTKSNNVYTGIAKQFENVLIGDFSPFFDGTTDLTPDEEVEESTEEGSTEGLEMEESDAEVDTMIPYAEKYPFLYDWTAVDDESYAYIPWINSMSAIAISEGDEGEFHKDLHWGGFAVTESAGPGSSSASQKPSSSGPSSSGSSSEMEKTESGTVAKLATSFGTFKIGNPEVSGINVNSKESTSTDVILDSTTGYRYHVQPTNYASISMLETNCYYGTSEFLEGQFSIKKGTASKTDNGTVTPYTITYTTLDGVSKTADYMYTLATESGYFLVICDTLESGTEMEKIASELIVEVK